MSGNPIRIMWQSGINTVHENFSGLVLESNRQLKVYFRSGELIGDEPFPDIDYPNLFGGKVVVISDAVGNTVAVFLIVNIKWLPINTLAPCCLLYTSRCV